MRYIHPIPGTDLEPIPADMPEIGKREEGFARLPPKRVDSMKVNKVIIILIVIIDLKVKITIVSFNLVCRCCKMETRAKVQLWFTPSVE